MFLNKVQIIGNITRDPELKALPGGTSVCSFSVATNRVWKDKNGEKQEQAEFHNIVVFGKTAENVARYMAKGSQIYIEGRLQTRSWDDKDSGKKRYATEVVAENVQFGNNRSKEDGTTQRKPREKDPAEKQWDAVKGDDIEYPEEDINPDDIPF